MRGRSQRHVPSVAPPPSNPYNVRRLFRVLVTDTKVGIFVLKGFLDLNWASTVVNTLLWAFFILGIAGMILGAYAAISMKKRERLLAEPVVEVRSDEAADA